MAESTEKDKLDGLYIKAHQSASGDVHVSAPTLIVLYILNYAQSGINIHLIRKTSLGHDPPMRWINIGQSALIQCQLKHRWITDIDVTEPVRQCQLPLILCRGGTYIQSGLCCVLRTVIKEAQLVDPARRIINLLGHKQSCLKAPAEVSSWTHFCEVDIPAMVSQQLHTNTPADKLALPPEIVKLENHLAEPVIIHNVGKRKREALSSQKMGQQPERNSIEKKHKSAKSCPNLPRLEHSYAEGADFTLTDLILFPCVTCLLHHWKHSLRDVSKHMPRVLQWYQRVAAETGVLDTAARCGLPAVDCCDDSVTDPPVNRAGGAVGTVSPGAVLDISTLSIRDPAKKKVKADAAHVANIIQKLKEGGISPRVSQHPCCNDLTLPWEQLPCQVHPSEGSLPPKRVLKKCQQLENLATAVAHIAKDGDVIVDFCSGGGHLGILLAHLLPQCKVILVENKEESITRACDRIAKLGLCNVTLYQCNLDYFTGAFNIGVCLHACGVATDLVMQRCLDNQASFVVCPCCYGGIQNTHTVTYPRSQQFARISYKEYTVLGHGADQTEFSIALAKQGKMCMNYIDTDRAALALEHGYEVTLCSLDPETCSPKNNLLIGVKKPTDPATGEDVT